MSTIINNVRWSDNTLELRNNLQAGIGTLDVMRTSVDRAVTSMGGSGLYGAANKAAVAIQELGGVTKLTTDEQERNLATIDKAIAKYQVMGQVAPQALLDTSKALHDSLQPTDDAGAKFEHLGEQIKLAFENPTQGIKQLSSAIANELTGSLATVAAVGTVAVTTLVAVGAAMLGLTEKAAAAGGALNDMGEKTGLGVPALSRLSNAVQVAGGDMDKMSNALFTLQKNIAENTDKFQTGLGRIGLTLDELKAAGPDRYLELIAKGFANTAEPSEKAAAAAEIFNQRLGRDLIPTLSKLDAALQSTNDIQPWTDEQAKQAEAFDMQMASLKVHAEALAISFGRDLIGPISEFTSVTVGATKAVLGLLGGFGGILTPVGALRAAWGDLSAALDVFLGHAEALPTVMGPAALGLKSWQDSITDMANVKVPNLSQAFVIAETSGKVLDDQLKAQSESAKQGAKEAEAYAKAWIKNSDEIAKLSAAASVAQLGSAKDTLAGKIAILEQERQSAIDIETTKIADTTKSEEQLAEALAAINAKYYADEYTLAIAAVRKIEEGKSDEGMKWVNQFNASERKATQSQFETTSKQISDTSKIWREYYDTIGKSSESAEEQQVAAIQLWYEDTVEKNKLAHENDQEYWAALELLAQAKLQNVYEAHSKYAQDTKKLLADLTDGPGGWVDTFSNILVHTGSFKDSVAGVWKLLKGDTLNIFGDLLADIIHSFLDQLLQAVADYVAKMILKLAILKTITSIFSFGLFSGGGVVGTGGGGGGSDSGDGFSRGGVVYAAEGWPFKSVGTDTVPAMLTPGERILSVAQNQEFERLGGLPALEDGMSKGFGKLPPGGSGGGGISEFHFNIVLGGRSIGRSVERVLTSELSSRQPLRVG